MSYASNLKGQRFGRLVVLERAGSDKHRNVRWSCQCDCGDVRTINGMALKAGQQSCGCLQREAASGLLTKHGLAHDPLYKLWNAIVQRTTNPNYIGYHNYGGRGIKLHPKWLEDAESFIKYLRMELGPKPTSKHSIDRIDNNGNYEPGNLRWATAAQQLKNRRPHNQWTRSQNGSV
jgi:hypothetical protein